MVFLILGAIVNVAVAWVSVLVQRDLSETSWGIKEWSTNTDAWPIDVPNDWPDAQSDAGWSHLGFRLSEIGGGLLPDEPHMAGPRTPWPYFKQFLLTIESGWPELSMRSWRESNDSKETWSRWKGAYVIGGRIRAVPGECPIPLQPIPLGFTLNTLFYAAILFAPCTALSELKRRRRVRRGLCIRCAYDLAGLNKCPECGTPSPLPRAGGRSVSSQF